MPVKTRAKSKVRKPVKKKKAVRAKIKKTVRKVMKKKAAVKKTMKKVTKKLVRAAAKPKGIGRVVHYYDRIGVAVLELTAPLRVGDMVRFERGQVTFVQPVQSLQVEHLAVEKAKKGDAVGMKVIQPIDRGAKVFPA